MNVSSGLETQRCGHLPRIIKGVGRIAKKTGKRIFFKKTKNKDMEAWTILHRPSRGWKEMFTKIDNDELMVIIMPCCCKMSLIG